MTAEPCAVCARPSREPTQFDTWECSHIACPNRHKLTAYPRAVLTEPLLYEERMNRYEPPADPD